MRFLAFLLVTGCTWEPQQHPNHGPPNNVIAGAVVANGVEIPTTTIIFVTDADNPMPPTGTGSPITLSTVPARDYSDSAGIPSATYAVSNVPDGDYLITGFMDMDEDFHPTVTAMAGATCGDIGGAHLADLLTAEFAVVSVEGGNYFDNVTVTLGSIFPVERPAFYPLFDGEPGNPWVSVGAAASGVLQTYTLRTTAVHARFDSGLEYHLEGPYEAVQPGKIWDPYLGEMVCETAFYGWIKDNDHDGFPDEHPDYPGLGLYDIWPRFGLTYLGEPIDSNDDGVPERFSNDLTEGESWASPGVVSPAMEWLLPTGIPFLTDTLQVVFLPAAQHTYPSAEASCPGDWSDGTCVETVMVPSQIPRGAWSITAISETGQTWTVPNQLVQSVSTDELSFQPFSQYTWLRVHD